MLRFDIVPVTQHMRPDVLFFFFFFLWDLLTLKKLQILERLDFRFVLRALLPLLLCPLGAMRLSSTLQYSVTPKSTGHPHMEGADI